LGAAPSFGSVRVFDGDQVAFRIEGLAGWGEPDAKGAAEMQIPSRVLVKRAGATKSCAEIAEFLAGAAPRREWASGHRWQEMNCAALPVIAETTPLELSKTVWNQPAWRWEFEVHCVRADDCVPFLIWVQETKISRTENVAPWSEANRPSNTSVATHTPGARESGGLKPLVQPGQTATLRWEQRGIRVVIPVTCLDGGNAGGLVRVRFKNSTTILRAEILSDRTLRATQ
jgi:hypothetical protein